MPLGHGTTKRNSLVLLDSNARIAIIGENGSKHSVPVKPGAPHQVIGGPEVSTVFHCTA
tara:strand:+ start:43817 stop:43993 length:177 start_codon:yes stop_codon:yes gene_type:complete